MRFKRWIAVPLVMILILSGCSFSNAADCYEPPIAEDPPLPADPPIPEGPAKPKGPPISEDPPMSDGPAIPAPYKGPKPYQPPEPYKPPEPYQPPEKYQPPSSMDNDKLFASISPMRAQGTSSVESESTEVDCTSISGLSIFSLLAAAILTIISMVFIFTVPVVGWSMLVGMAFGGLAGWLSGGSATEIAMDAVYGGIAGAVGLGAFAGTARLLGRMAMTSTWMGRWFPWLGSGGAAGVGETATFDFLKEGKVNWKNALLAGLLGGLLGFGGGVITDHGHKLKALIPQLENRVVVAADGPVGRFIYNHFDDAADGYRRSQGNGETSTTTRDGAKVTSAYGYASKVSDRTTVTGEYPDSDWEKERSKILRAELKAAEVEPPPYPNAAHHIVPWNDPRADQAQKILKEYGIETESAVNGVFLPYEKGSKYIGDEALHSGNHGKNYVMEVNNRLVEAKEEGGTREDIVDELNQIRKELLDGTLSLN